MFRVYDGRKKCKSMVAKYAARDPFVGVLIAAAILNGRVDGRFRLWAKDRQ